MSNTVETILLTADYQIPYQDERAHRALLSYASDLQPDVHIDHGDFIDFPSLGRFRTTLEVKTRLPQDIDEARRINKELTNAMPKTKRVLIRGNHDDRLVKYILDSAPALEHLLKPGEALDMNQILADDNLTIIGPYPEAYLYRGLVFKHGERTSKYSAALELQDEGESGVSGHTHRFQVFSMTNRSGTHAWYSLPCMCHINSIDGPPGVKAGIRNWQTGFAVMRIVGDGDDRVFNIYPIIVTDGQFISPEGKLYKG